MGLSVVLATYNEEDRLGECLASIKDVVDEIVVVDGRSTDRTIEIAKSFGAKTKIVDNEYIFHINKQKAVDLATKDWILQLDADEIVPERLKAEITDVVRGKKKGFEGYYLTRKNYFLGHWMRKGGQYPDPVIRLFRRGKGYFPQKSVHEQILVDGPVGCLKTDLLHYPYQTFAEYLEKAMRYSHLVARELQSEHKPKTPMSAFEYFFVKPCVTFLSLFIRHQGFVDGIYGFLFAFFSALQPQIGYIKYLYGKNLD